MLVKPHWVTVGRHASSALNSSHSALDRPELEELELSPLLDPELTLQVPPGTGVERRRREERQLDECLALHDGQRAPRLRARHEESNLEPRQLGAAGADHHREISGVLQESCPLPSAVEVS